MNVQSPPDTSVGLARLRDVRALRLGALRGDRVTPDRLSQIGFPPPSTARELRDLAYDGQSVWIACHLGDVGLGDLEDIERQLISREVEFALAEAGSTSIETAAEPGSVKISWVWPKAVFVNAVSVSVEVFYLPEGSGNPPARVGEKHTFNKRRDFGKSSGSLPLSLDGLQVDSECRVEFSLAVRSASSGRDYPGHEKELAAITVPGVPRPESSRGIRFDDSARRPRSEPELVVTDLSQPEPMLLTRLKGRAVLIGTATILFLGIIAAAVWAFSGEESDPYHSCKPIFGTPTGEPVNWNSPTVQLPEGVGVFEGMLCKIGGN